MLQTMKILAGAMIAGVTFFLVIIVAVLRSGKLFADDLWSVTDVLVILGLGMAAMLAVMSFLVPRLVAAGAIRQLGKPDPKERAPEGWEGWSPRAPRLLPVYQTSLILRLALLEGAAFFNLIVFMLKGNALALLAALVLIALMILSFPIESKIRDWIERMTASNDVI